MLPGRMCKAMLVFRFAQAPSIQPCSSISNRAVTHPSGACGTSPPPVPCGDTAQRVLCTRVTEAQPRLPPSTSCFGYSSVPALQSCHLYLHSCLDHWERRWPRLLSTEGKVVGSPLEQMSCCLHTGLWAKLSLCKVSTAWQLASRQLCLGSSPCLSSHSSLLSRPGVTLC